ncbi:MAG TPA: methylenetetrahydrofolate reductase C-terminal domain-containing protein, partial [Candidatus Sumerlaeota bacterium]|nr:methylenetetrahydrofolate reductase C-terminal domain-containing protein [Candidatus Sumerlaeota bacterium]
LRNGPCGGSMDGHCEVYPDRRCIWTQIHTRADRAGWMKLKLARIQPAVDWRLFGTSAWLNIWPGKKIDADGHAFSPAPVPSDNRWARAAEE